MSIEPDLPRKYRATALDCIKASAAVSGTITSHSMDRINSTSFSSRPEEKPVISG